MKKITSVLLCIILVLSLCSCSIDNNSVLTMGVNDTINSYDPIEALTDAEKILATNCFEGLLRFNNDGKITLAGATGYTIGKSALTYTFTLNPDAHFYCDNSVKKIAEGLGLKDFKTQITAEDYVFGINRYSSENPDVFPYIENAKAIDNFTLEITLKETDPDFLYKLASMPIYPCRKDFCEKSASIYGTTPATILTNGPYYIKSSTQSETILVRNPKYNGNIQILNKQVTLYTTGVVESFEERFANGNYDFYIGDKQNEPDNPSSTITYTTGIWGVAFNCTTDIGKNEAIRTAIMSELDFTELPAPDFAIAKTDKIFPDNSIIGDTKYSDFASDTVSFTANTTVSKKAIESYISKNGTEKLVIDFYVPEEYVDSVKTIKKSLAETFGELVEITVTAFKVADTQDILDENKYDMAILPLNIDVNTVYEVVNSLREPPCSYNNKSYNKIINNISSVTTEAFNDYSKAETHIIQKGVFFPLFTTGISLYLNTGVTGIYAADSGNHIYLHSGAKV